jgi:aerobic C4-dicarboxylate transport protein
MLAHPVVPAAGIAMTLGVDRFLNEGRAVVNLIGNAVATLAIARWDNSLDVQRMRAVLQGKVPYIDEEIAAPTYVTSSPLRDTSASAQA